MKCLQLAPADAVRNRRQHTHLLNLMVPRIGGGLDWNTVLGLLAADGLPRMSAG